MQGAHVVWCTDVVAYAACVCIERGTSAYMVVVVCCSFLKPGRFQKLATFVMIVGLLALLDSIQIVNSETRVVCRSSLQRVVRVPRKVLLQHRYKALGGTTSHAGPCGCWFSKALKKINRRSPADLQSVVDAFAGA